MKLVHTKRFVRSYQQSTSSSSYWKDPDVQRDFFDTLGRQLGVHKKDDWYNIHPSHVSQNGGSSLLSLYGNSMIRALSTIYHEHDWVFSKFDKVPNGFWDDFENQRDFLNQISKSLNINTWEDWYNVKQSDFKMKGGAGLLESYNFSFINLLKTVFPEHPWVSWKFSRAPMGYWNNLDNVTSVVKYIEQEFSIHNVEDWYKITRVRLIKAGFDGLLVKFGGLQSILKEVYPDHEWKNFRHSSNDKTKIQTTLFKIIQKLFAGIDVHNNFIHSKLIYQESKKNMELDIFIPSLSLAFEYQGEHHYQLFDEDSTENSIENPKENSKRPHYNSSRVSKSRDDEKRRCCHANGITLVEIPYWWDGQKESLAATIKQNLPHLLQDYTLSKDAKAISSIEPKTLMN